MPLGLDGARRGLGLARMLRAERPAIFHAHLGWPLAAKWGLAAPVLAPLSHVATIHPIPDFELGGPVPGTDEEAALAVRKKLALEGEPRDVYRASKEDLQIVYPGKTLHVNPETGHVLEEGQRPRFFLRLANWLHLNRGKKAWTYVADFYAGGLLLLALTGMVLNTGRKGLFGRGGILVLLGIAVPIVYVQVSGGPEGGKKARPKMEAPAKPSP